MNLNQSNKTTAEVHLNNSAANALSRDNEAICRYQSKHCGNVRSLKGDGKYHNLCAEHRASANNNQRKLDRKKRTGKQLHGRAGKRTIQLAPVRQERFQLPTINKSNMEPTPLIDQLLQEASLDHEDYSFLVDCFASGTATPVGLTPAHQSKKNEEFFALHGNHSSQTKKSPANKGWQSFIKVEWNQNKIVSKHDENDSSFSSNPVVNNVPAFLNV